MMPEMDDNALEGLAATLSSGGEGLDVATPSSSFLTSSSKSSTAEGSASVITSSLLPIRGRGMVSQEDTKIPQNGLLPIASKTSEQYLKKAIETHEGSIGRSSTVESTIASSSDVDPNEEDIIASLYPISAQPSATGDKTSRRSSKCQLGLPQGFMGMGIDSEASELELSPSSSSPTKGTKTVHFGLSSPKAVMVKNDSSGELTRRTTNRLRRFRSSSVVTAVHVYDDVEYDCEDMWWRLTDDGGGVGAEDDGFNEDMFLSRDEEEDTSDVDSDKEEDSSPSEKQERAPQAPKPVQLRRAESAPANALFPNSPMASSSEGDVFAALVSPIHRSTPCDPSSPCRTITCAVDNTIPCGGGRRHSVGEVIRNRTDREMHNPFLMADLQARRSSYWRRRHVPCPVHS